MPFLHFALTQAATHVTSWKTLSSETYLEYIKAWQATEEFLQTIASLSPHDVDKKSTPRSIMQSTEEEEEENSAEEVDEEDLPIIRPMSGKVMATALQRQALSPFVPLMRDFAALEESFLMQSVSALKGSIKAETMDIFLQEVHTEQLQIADLLEKSLARCVTIGAAGHAAEVWVGVLIRVLTTVHEGWQTTLLQLRQKMLKDNTAFTEDVVVNAISVGVRGMESFSTYAGGLHQFEQLFPRVILETMAKEEAPLLLSLLPASSLPDVADFLAPSPSLVLACRVSAWHLAAEAQAFVFATLSEPLQMHLRHVMAAVKPKETMVKEEEKDATPGAALRRPKVTPHYSAAPSDAISRAAETLLLLPQQVELVLATSGPALMTSLLPLLPYSGMRGEQLFFDPFLAMSLDEKALVSVALRPATETPPPLSKAASDVAIEQESTISLEKETTEETSPLHAWIEALTLHAQRFLVHALGAYLTHPEEMDPTSYRQIKEDVRYFVNILGALGIAPIDALAPLSSESTLPSPTSK